MHDDEDYFDIEKSWAAVGIVVLIVMLSIVALASIVSRMVG